jgi:hypothetical protein
MNVHDEMSDADVLRAAADFLSAIAVPSAPDAAAIITTGRTRRRRMTGLSIAGTAAVTVVALGLSGAFGSTSHQPSHPAHAQLTAWTVTKLADGEIFVRINQFKDPAGLQSTLRADGVPASVTFANASQLNPACQPYPGGTLPPGFGPPPPLLKRVFPHSYQGGAPPPDGQGRARSVKATGNWLAATSGNFVAVVIDPSALPRNAGVQLASSDAAATQALMLPRVVYASAQCTGS